MQKRKRATVPPIQVDLIPVLSCMFLLVPALLLAMEAANWAAIPVQPPLTRSGVEPTSDPDEARVLQVQVRDDGFALSMGRCRSCAPEQVVGLQGGDGLEGLRAVAKEIKAAHPAVESVHLSAEASIRLQTLVETMDALRGDACSLAEDGDRAGCLFPGVVIEG